MLLLDQNISFRVVRALQAIYPGCCQVRELGLENASDFEISKYAKQHGLAIVTFDLDFYELSLVHGSPPKIIWLRIGNSTSQALVGLLQEKSSIVYAFLTAPDFETVHCLEIRR
jgi:predicted nuclease of predicted toxin-antitoxin system